MTYLENSLPLSLKVKYKLTSVSYARGVLLLGVYQREMKTNVHTKSYTWKYIAVLFKVGPN